VTLAPPEQHSAFLHAPSLLPLIEQACRHKFSAG
jgi:hypothetical protein